MLTAKSISRWHYPIGILLLVLGNIAFSGKAVIIKMAYRHQIDAYSLLALRMLFAAPFYIALLIAQQLRPDAKKINLKQWLHISILGFLGYYIASLLDFLGLQYVTASMERLILYLYPTMVLVLSWLIFKQKITRIQYWALFITYGGVLLTFSGEIFAGTQRNLPLGAALIFTCALAYAIYVVFTGKMVREVGTWQFTCYAMLSATLGVIVQSWFHNGLAVFHYPKDVYVLSVWLAVAATVLPTFMVAEGLRRVGANDGAVIGFIGPIATIVLGYWLLGEPITPMQLLGTAVVGAGVLLISMKRSSPLTG